MLHVFGCNTTLGRSPTHVGRWIDGSHETRSQCMRAALVDRNVGVSPGGCL